MEKVSRWAAQQLPFLCATLSVCHGLFHVALTIVISGKLSSERLSYLSDVESFSELGRGTMCGLP